MTHRRGHPNGAARACQPDVLAAATDGHYRSGRILVPYRYERSRTQYPLDGVGSQGGISRDDQHYLWLLFAYVL